MSVIRSDDGELRIDATLRTAGLDCTVYSSPAVGSGVGLGVTGITDGVGGNDGVEVSLVGS